MQIILGNFGTGKTNYVLQQVFDLLNQNESFMIIVPSRRHKDELLLKLLKQTNGLIGSPILTLSELQDKMIEQLIPVPHERPRSLTNFENFLIISSIISDNTDKFKVLHTIKNRPELLKIIYRLIRSLRDKDIEILKLTPELQDKIEDLQWILNKYKETLHSLNIGDIKYEVDFICQNINNISSGFFPSHIFIDGFTDFTASQYKLIKHILEFSQNISRNLTITLPQVSHPISVNTINTLIQDFPTAKQIIISNQTEASYLSNSFLTNQAFNIDRLKFHEIQAYGKNKEIEYTINQIKKLCLEENHSLEDILIISQQPEQYYTILQSALRKAQLPFIFGKDEKLSQNSLIIFIKRLIKLMTEDLSHESFAFLSQSNYIHQKFQKLWSASWSTVPNAIEGKYEIWDRYCKQQENTLKNEQDIHKLNELQYFQDSIKQLCQHLYSLSIHEKYSIHTIIQNLVDLIEFLGIQNSLSETHSLILHRKIIEVSVAKDFAALSKLKEILLELQKSLDTMNHKKLSLQEFLFFFDMIVDETQYRSHIPQKNVLRILNSEDARGIFVKSVFILGLNEGEFPPPPKLELFNHLDRKQLNSVSQKIFGRSLWDTEIEYYDEQKFLFASILARASQNIFFSRTPINEKGVYFNTSHFLQKIFDLNIPYTQIPFTPNKVVDNPEIFQKRHSASEYYELSHLFFISKHKNSHESVKNYYNYQTIINEANTLFDKGEIPSNNHLKYFGYIPNVSYVTKKYQTSEIYISPTHLERIGRCRYQGLWKSVWRLEPYILPQYRPENAEYGTLYHEVLELYIQQTQHNEEIFDPKILSDILQKSIEKHPQAHVFNIDYQYIFTILSTYLQKIEPELRQYNQVKFLELSSGQGELVNKVISLDNTISLNVSSRIDRVDYNTQNSSYSVIDYKKRGLNTYKDYQKTPFSLFQGFLYGELLRQNNKFPIENISYVFLEKQEIFEEYPDKSNKKRLYQSIDDFYHLKSKEIIQLITLLSQGNFSPFTLKSDLGSDLSDIFTEKFGENFAIESPTKCAHCKFQKLCLRQQKKVKTY